MFDAYSRHARLTPAVLAAAPALMLAICGAVRLDKRSSIAAAVLGAAGVLVCGLVRDRGRAIQPALWRSWAGPPATAKLRWREAQDPQGHQRLLDQVQRAVAMTLPTAEEERQDPDAADRRYDQAVAQLRARTRDTSQFRLLLHENAEYGFRRNCLGLRPLALAVSGIALMCSVYAVAAGDERFVLPSLVSMLAFVGWLRVVKAGWVRNAADRYAERLLETAEVLPDSA